MLVSTEKDLARLAGSTGTLAALAAATRTLPVRLAFAEADAERLGALIDSALKGRRDRRGRRRTGPPQPRSPPSMLATSPSSRATL